MRAIIFANGKLENPAAARALIRPDDTIIAADGGAAHCHALGILPSIIIGDLDSLSAEEVEAWQQKGVEIIQHDPRKDETDLELALLLAQGLAREEALVFGALGGRWDQTIANLLLPAYSRLEDIDITYWHAGTWFYLVRSECTIHARAGQTVSLIPLGGDAVGVTTEGLEWPLEAETLQFGATRGVSNLMLGETATIHLQSGLLLCAVLDVE